MNYKTAYKDWEKRRKYLTEKAREYNTKKRGKPARKYITFTQVEIIFKSAGHCSYCGCLLSSEWHAKNMLKGCEVAVNRVRNENVDKQ